ncbi:MFS transporter [Acinetobacter sp. c1-l78]|uniref:AmpG family muropeptide MFS transporter n=1 Tax=Acinetobacter sp. c1-l78 TaxID=3342803 RepID=UPI0035BA4BF5
MSQSTKNWQSAFSAFADRRALIMLFLGFSAGIPILLIFSSLSLWLGEAGISRSAVTMFSWAALGYSFKFVWAPLIDELPVAYLTQKLGRRRAWLLIAQSLIVVAICIMAMTDPTQGNSALVQMAIGAVLLGFASATQDIVIDAYRIELAEKEMQAVLASTYNAGYRIGMIVAGAGALFIAAALGTAKGNYIYTAWQTTYFIMAATMLVGIITTLVIREPQVQRIYKDYHKVDYLRLVAVFIFAVAGFVLSFIYVGETFEKFAVTDPLLSFGLEAVRFIVSIISAVVVGTILVKLGVVNKQMAVEIWVAPIKDFFQRYGLKLALVLLLMIGFYRVSDIVAGVISNVFYQDMNFTKEQIATAVKTYGVIFALVGGFLGGLLSQRFNIMKMMLLGAVLMSTTNLIFIGLVKSGTTTTDVTVNIGNQQFIAKTDEVGAWKVNVPSQLLLQNQNISTTVAYANRPELVISRELPYLHQQAGQTVQMQLLPISRDNQLDSNELKQSVVVEGQILGLSEQQISNKDKSVVKLNLDGKNYDAKIDKDGKFSTAITADDLSKSATKTILASYQQDGVDLKHQQQYQLLAQANSYKLDNFIEPLPLINSDKEEYTIKGKVVKEYSVFWLYAAIILDNLASGLAGAVFIAFLSSLTNVSFTAVQYAIFSSLMTLTPKIVGGYSGKIVDSIGYPNFFLMTALLSIPILFLILWVSKLLRQHEQNQPSTEA